MATHDLLGTLEANAVLGLGTADAAVATQKGTLLGAAITAVSEKLAQNVGTIVYATVTAELHNGGSSFVYLDHQPVAQVVQVVEYDNTDAGTLTAETNATKTATNYILEPDTGRVVRRNANVDADFPPGRNNVLVTYVAGRYSSTSTVGQRFKEAAALTLKSLWRAYENSAAQVNEFDVPIAQFPRFTIPNAVKDLLADEWRTGSGTGD